MSANGPIEMYSLKPIYNFSEEITLPTCMYKLPNIYADNQRSSVEHEKLNSLEKCQEKILLQLDALKKQVQEMRSELGIPAKSCKLADSNTVLQDIVIYANPNCPPLSLWVFCNHLGYKIRMSTYVHSSISVPPDIVKHYKENPETFTSDFSHSVKLIWKDVKDPELIVCPLIQNTICGEVNIIRYFARLTNSMYDETDPLTSTKIDEWLDIAHSTVLHGNAKDKQVSLKTLDSHLKNGSYLVGDNLSIADIAMWSALKQTKLNSHLPNNVKKWWENITSNKIFSLPELV